MLTRLVSMLLLSPFDCCPANPAGPYVAGGPVGPDEKFQVLDPLEHSGPDHADPAGQHAVFQDVLEPLEHSVLDTALDGRPMVGFPVLGPIEYSVLEMTLDGGHSEMTIDEEPLAHSVLDVALDGRSMEGIPIPEPLEHSVLGGGGLDSGLMEGMSHLEPLEHSVLYAARGNCSRKEASVCEPLEHSVRMMTLDDSPLEKMSDEEPLEHARCRRDLSAFGGGPSSAPVIVFGFEDGFGERAPDGRWGNAVWSRPRSNIVGWSPRDEDCRPDIGWVGSASGRWMLAE